MTKKISEWKKVYTRKAKGRTVANVMKRVKWTNTTKGLPWQRLPHQDCLKTYSWFMMSLSLETCELRSQKHINNCASKEISLVNIFTCPVVLRMGCFQCLCTSAIVEQQHAREDEGQPSPPPFLECSAGVRHCYVCLEDVCQSGRLETFNNATFKRGNEIALRISDSLRNPYPSRVDVSYLQHRKN